ncbi:TFIIB-type zinc ribbon-containing protein [Sporosarcina globispora]|uniref:TFIIB-type zinc ribbon-containing protein n=1 Tax=Sporosarcina globispora TaxID=1459 RepID=UPI00137934BC
MYNIEKNMLCAEPVKLNKKAEEIEYSSKFKCPFCGSVNHDAWELSDEGETYCGSCGSDLEYESVVTVEYNIRPKKCSPITQM